MFEGDRGSDVISPGSRREALAAMLTGSALGIAALREAPPRVAAKGKKGKKKRSQKHRNGGKGNGGKGNVGDGSPSVRFVETTTTFDSEGVVSAFSKCPDGYLPIGGGFFSSIENPTLYTSTPRLIENDWEIETGGAQTGHEITVTAICLAASDDTKDEDTVGEARGRGKKKKRSRRR